jgi:hypothetical protein
MGPERYRSHQTPAVALSSPRRRGAAQGAAQGAPTEPGRPSGPRLANSSSLIEGFDREAARVESFGPLDFCRQIIARSTGIIVFPWNVG